MTKVGFSSLPNELVLQIAFDTDDSSLLSLLLCNRNLMNLLTPVIHTRALAPRGDQSAMQWAATQGYECLVKVSSNPRLPHPLLLTPSSFCSLVECTPTLEPRTLRRLPS